MTDGAGAARLREWIAGNAAARGGQAYVESIDQGQTLTYADLAQTVDRIGAYLAERNIGANDRVVLLSDNCVEHLLVYLGVMAHGATICTVNVETAGNNLPDILKSVEPKLVVYETELEVGGAPGAAGCEALPLGRWGENDASSFIGRIRSSAPGRRAHLPDRPDDDAVIYFTSGTTAHAKGVILSFRTLLRNAEATAAAFGLSEADRLLDYRSFNWASAQILSALAPLSAGATLILAKKFSQSRFFSWVRDYRATVAAGNPTVINMLFNRSRRNDAKGLSHLRFMTSSSAPLRVDEWKRFEERFGIKVAQGYGTSETGWIAGSDEKTRRMGSVGKPFPYHELRIVDSDGNPLPAGETGLVVLGGAPEARYRYLGSPDDRIAAKKDGIATGDLGYVDPDGYLYVTGRVKDLIVRGGVNIAPAEVEAVLASHPAIGQAAVVGVPDPIYGEEVVAFVVPRDGETPSIADLMAHCAALPAIKRPKNIALCDDLPRTARGKLDRKALVASWPAAIAERA